MASGCRRCGGAKPAGRGRQYCDACRESALPVWQQAEHVRRARRPGEKLPTPPGGTRWCNGCGRYRHTSAFGPGASYCRPCASMRAFRSHLQRTYGITVERYDEFLAYQDGRCAICRRRPRVRRLAVDHDHSTGKIRGLLCSDCNHRVLGGAHESVEVLRAAAAYLEDPPGNHI